VAWLCLAIALAAPSSPARAERVYVSNEDDGTVTVIDADRAAAIATIAVGKRPRGLALSPDGRVLYVAVSGLPKCPPPIPEAECAKLARDPGADGVAVVDAARLERTRLIGGVSDPERIAVSRDGRRLFVTEEDLGRVAVLDVACGRLLRAVSVGAEPEGVRVAPNGRWVLATSEQDNTVTIIDANSYAVVGRVAVGRRPRDLALTPDSRFAYVSGEEDATVYRIAVPRGTPAERVLQLRPQARPMGVALDAARGRLYVSTGRAGTVAVAALEGLRLLTEVATGGRPWGIALGAGGLRLFSANGPAGDVSIVDTAALAATDRVPTGKGPWGVVAGP
jgi:YVTN family beta-propeller protein